jgi:hypothetical protein
MLADLWGLIGRPPCILPERFGLLSEAPTIHSKSCCPMLRQSAGQIGDFRSCAMTKGGVRL